MNKEYKNKMTENTPTSSSTLGEATVGTLNASQLAVVMNADKSILRSIGSICFRRCIPSYEKEYLNEAEMVCVDRCTYKYDQMLKHVVENNPALRVWHKRTRLKDKATFKATVICSFYVQFLLTRAIN